MRIGLLFPKVTDRASREALLKAILSIKCLIPSLKSLHENLKYLGVGAKILNDLILGKGNRSTLYKALKDSWKPPAEIPVEIAENKYCRLRSDSIQSGWDLVYKQIWISAFRNFAELGGRRPRKEVGQPQNAEVANPNSQFQFVHFVHELGIQTRRVKERLRQDPRRESIRLSINQIYKLQSSTFVERLLDKMLLELPPITDGPRIKPSEL